MIHKPKEMFKRELEILENKYETSTKLKVVFSEKNKNPQSLLGSLCAFLCSL
jgi:hypothetical protein